MCALGNSKGRSPLGLSGLPRGENAPSRAASSRNRLSFSSFTFFVALAARFSTLQHISARSRASLFAPISNWSSQLCSVVAFVVSSASTLTVKVHSCDHPSRVALHNVVAYCTRVARSLAGNCIKRTNSAIRQFCRIDLVYLTSCFNELIYSLSLSLCLLPSSFSSSLYNLLKVFPKYSCWSIRFDFI